MLTIDGYKCYSFTVGCKHIRTFALASTGGTIADYVLGECRKGSSPLPEEFYGQVRIGNDSVELSDKEGARRFVCSLDKVIISERSARPEDEFSDTKGVVNRARTLIPDVLKFINNPSLNFLGMVWEYVEETEKERERFKHPVAQELWKRLLKVRLVENKEYPAELQTKMTFRKRIERSLTSRSMNDYINVIINCADAARNDLWGDESRPRDDVSFEAVKTGMISIDVQRVFDPRKQLDKGMFDTHWSQCATLMKRMGEILGEVGFVTGLKS